jgi:TRAP-type transport system small permease protein
MARALTAIVTSVDRAFRFVIWLLTAAMVAIVVLQVFMRYVLNAALSWPEELTRYFMIWSGLLAAVYAHNEGQHVGIGLLFDRMGPRLQRVTQAVSQALIASLCVLIAWQGAKSLASYSEIKSTALRIRMDIIYAAVPVSFLLLALVSVKLLIKPLTKAEK